VFMLGWMVLMALWLGLGLPLGPGAPMEYVPAGG
jgi:aminobenzoyl-glutamate transport protein